MSDIEAQRDKRSFIFREDAAPGLKLEMELNKIFVSTQSKFQQVDILETYFGKVRRKTYLLCSRFSNKNLKIFNFYSVIFSLKTLVTDGKTQSAQLDEFAYHESLVHPSLLRTAFTGTPPKKVFIGGGGELATAREVLRHKSVERVVMLDIDEKVIELCKEFLPEWGGEKVASDSRLELIIGDAHKWMMETQEKFDVIIMDISDPIEAGPGIALYTKEFYQHALTRLNMPGGVFVTQAGTAEAVPPPHASEGASDTSCYGPIHNTLRAVFDCVVPYSVNIPSFGGDWGFMMAFQAPPGRENEKALVEREWQFPSDTATIDNLIEQQIEGGASSLGLYDGESHMSLMALTKCLRKLLKNDKRVMTKDNPVFMF